MKQHRIKKKIEEISLRYSRQRGREWGCPYRVVLLVVDGNGDGGHELVALEGSLLSLRLLAHHSKLNLFSSSTIINFVKR
jgi:hypothetical protein